MAGADEVWAWLYPSIQDLKADRAAEPDTPWETRRAAFLDGLGLVDASGHPVVELLLNRLDELPDQDRDELLGDDQLDTIAYDLVQRLTEPETAPDGEGEGEREGGDPLGWVSEDQRGHLEAVWGADWPAALWADLDVRWGPDWWTHPAEHRTAWLADLVATGAFPVRQEQPAAPIPEALTEALADIPGIERLTPEEITQVINSVLQKMGR